MSDLETRVLAAVAEYGRTREAVLAATNCLDRGQGSFSEMRVRNGAWLAARDRLDQLAGEYVLARAWSA
ncbi:hypothetical protein [Nakamurella leprariae]|uniref:Uncharacterized protein n=1 Tax=Nakamurella leprariae TaxID=2803911 RepID=A0A939BYM6_9ACTN|nr:hypothetical protein [Nakamurella leprariae]MBM9467245.1 hypothetical protein [Nakamurella leprariae]